MQRPLAFFFLFQFPGYEFTKSLHSIATLCLGLGYNSSGAGAHKAVKSRHLLSGFPRGSTAVVTTPRSVVYIPPDAESDHRSVGCADARESARAFRTARGQSGRRKNRKRT